MANTSGLRSDAPRGMFPRPTANESCPGGFDLSAAARAARSPILVAAGAPIAALAGSFVGANQRRPGWNLASQC